MAERRQDGAQTGGAAGGGGPFGFLSRRRWLKATLWTGGAVLGGLGAAGLWLRGCAPAVIGLEHLDDQEYRTLAKLVTVLFPPGGLIDVDASDMDLPRAFDEFLDGEPDENVSNLRTALTLLEYGPVVYDKRFTTFSELPRDEAQAHWDRWAVSDDLLRRQVSVAFRKVLTMFFYDREEVWPHIGYPGPSLAALGEDQ